MAKIIGNTTATPNPRPDWAQMDETKADYIKNKPELIGQITEENGEIFNDYENNMAYGEFTHAEGEGTTVGCTGYLITNIEKVNTEDTLPYYDSGSSIIITTEVNTEYAVGDVVSIRMFATVGYLRWGLDIGTITDISGNTITVQIVDDRKTDDVFAPPDSEKYPTKPMEDMLSYLWVAKKPRVGNISLFTAGHAEGLETIAIGTAAHAEGKETIANGPNSHAEGRETFAGYAAHAEGRGTKAYYEQSHAEGTNTIAYNGHAEGIKSISYVRAAHAEGEETKAKGSRSHSEGFYTEAIGNDSHAEGSYTKAEGEGAHAEGGYYWDGAKNIKTTAKGKYSHAEGEGAAAEAEASHAEGKNTKANGNFSHAEGLNAVATGTGAHAEGYTDPAYYPENAKGNYSHTEGTNNVAEGQNAHAEGKYTKAIGDSSHSEGEETKAENQATHAEGKGSVANGFAAHAEGGSTKANGDYSHTEGKNVMAHGTGAHAEGINTDASYYKENAYGEASHTEGTNARAYAKNSHVGGANSTAGIKDSPNTAENAFVHGSGLSATKYKSQVVFGNNNLEEDNAIFAIGNGYWGNLEDGKSGTIRKNAVVVKQSNPNCGSYSPTKAYMEVESQGTTDKSVVIKKTLDDKVAELAGMFTGSIKKTVVEELPTTGDENTIYMVGPKVTDDGTDYYEEYMFIGGKPEIIGNTKTDLSSKMDKFGDYDPNEWKLYLTNKKNGSVPPFTIYNGNELTVEGKMGVNLKTDYKIGLSGAYTEIEGTYLSLRGRLDTDGNGMSIMGVNTPITEEDIKHNPYQYGFMSENQVPYQAANKKYVDTAIETVNGNISYIEEFIDRVAEATSAEDIIAIAQDIKAKKNQI